MTPLKKAAIFLMLIGAEKGQKVIALMDNSEIKAVVPEIRRLAAVSREVQENIWTELMEIGYEDKLNPAETLDIMRFLFNGGRISGKC